MANYVDGGVTNPGRDLGIAGFVSSLLGFVVFIPAVVGLVLSLMSIRRSKSSGFPVSALAIAGIVISAAWLVLLLAGIIAAVTFRGGGVTGVPIIIPPG